MDSVSGSSTSIHAMRELLPRELFAKDRSLFRMDAPGGSGRRRQSLRPFRKGTRDRRGQRLEVRREPQTLDEAILLLGRRRPALVPLPGMPRVTDSDQAMLFENHLMRSLRNLDPNAALAHLAYASTLGPARRER